MHWEGLHFLFSTLSCLEHVTCVCDLISWKTEVTKRSKSERDFVIRPSVEWIQECSRSIHCLAAKQAGFVQWGHVIRSEAEHISFESMCCITRSVIPSMNFGWSFGAATRKMLSTFSCWKEETMFMLPTNESSREGSLLLFPWYKPLSSNPFRILCPTRVGFQCVHWRKQQESLQSSWIPS